MDDPVRSASATWSGSDTQAKLSLPPFEAEDAYLIVNARVAIDRRRTGTEVRATRRGAEWRKPS